MSGGVEEWEGQGGVGTTWQAWHHVAGPELAVPAPPRTRLVSLRLCPRAPPKYTWSLWWPGPLCGLIDAASLHPSPRLLVG